MASIISSYPRLTYVVINTVTSDIIYNGSLKQCDLYIETRLGDSKYCKIMQAINIEGELFPYE